MDETTFILVITSGSISSLCLCCICVQAVKYIIRDRSIKKMKEIAIKKRENLRYNYSVYPEAENLRHSELV